MSVLFASLGISNASALTVTVTAAGERQSATAVTTHVRRLDRVVAERDLELAVGVSTDLDLGEGTWEITAKSPSLWAAPVYATGSEIVSLQLWPRGSVNAKLGGHVPASGELIVNFAPARPSDAAGGPAGTAVCGFVSKDWSCSLPAGELDLRLGLVGFATEFRWQVKIGDDAPVNLGRIDFTPGSSVSGKIVARDVSQKDLFKTTEVLLAPENSDFSRGKARQYTAKPDARGFFQIRGLVPGRFTLQARAGRALVSDTRSVEIIGQTNASLKEPLVLARPARIGIGVTPPVDENGKPWQIELLMRQPGANRMEVIDRSLASPKGTWSQIGASPGDYRLKIEQQDGSEWKTEDLTLRAGDGDLQLDVAVTGQRVAGTVKLGDRPIAAEVRFSNERGPRFVADQRGRFQGAIPTLEDEEINILVASETPDIKRTLLLKGDLSENGELIFDIVLPATTILGRTVNEDGTPEPSAIVTLESADGRTFEQMFPHKDGSFQFEGFEPGRYTLQADAFQKVSAVVNFEAAAESLSSTDLMLHPQTEVRGRVTMGTIPIAGAEVYALPRGVKTAFVPTATSDAGGQFVLALPPGTTVYDAIVFPRGFYSTAARITRDPKQDLRVEVGQDGGSLTVNAAGDATSVLLVHAGGEYSLSWVAQKSGGTASGADGRQRVTIPNLEPGQYAVCKDQKCTSVYVPPFAAASVTVE